MTGATSARIPSRRITLDKATWQRAFSRTDRTYQPRSPEVRPDWRGPAGPLVGGPGDPPCYTPAVLVNERDGPRTRRSAIALAWRIGRPERRPSDQTTGDPPKRRRRQRERSTQTPDHGLGFSFGGAGGGRGERCRLRVFAHAP